MFSTTAEFLTTLQRRCYPPPSSVEKEMDALKDKRQTDFEKTEQMLYSDVSTVRLYPSDRIDLEKEQVGKNTEEQSSFTYNIDTVARARANSFSSIDNNNTSCYNRSRSYSSPDVTIHAIPSLPVSLSRDSIVQSIYSKVRLSRRSTVLALTTVAIFFLFRIQTFQSNSYAQDDAVKPKAPLTQRLLLYVQNHPQEGLLAYIFVYALFIVLLLPGTPLTLGGGYVFTQRYGWLTGIGFGSMFSMLGSLLGSCAAFCLGRFWMRERVRKWIRNYPLFEAIDGAMANNGLRIMSLLCLTPVLPLGPVSYMLGTTSMDLSSFALSRIASLPLMTLYVFVGASTGSLISDAAGPSNADLDDSGSSSTKEKHLLMIFGIILSIISITVISRIVRKELNKYLHTKKGDKSTGDAKSFDSASSNSTATISGSSSLGSGSGNDASFSEHIKLV